MKSEYQYYLDLGKFRNPENKSNCQRVVSEKKKTQKAEKKNTRVKTARNSFLACTNETNQQFGYTA